MAIVNDYFLIPPNWESGILFKKRWRTSIQRSINNATVKRSALFTWPRRVLTFQIDAYSYAQTAFIKRKIYRNLENIWGIPFWQDESLLTVEAASGQAILTVNDTDNRNYEVGGECILYLDRDTYNVGTILSKTATTITLTNNLPLTWPIGTSVYPIFKARISKTQNITYITDQKSQIKIDGIEEFDEITRNIPSISSFPLHKGYPVFNTPPDWAQPINEDQIHNYELLQYIGKSQSWDEWSDTDFRYKAMYYGEDKTSAQNIFDFFDYHKGRFKGFWRPSWFTDIKITADVDVADAIIEIEDIDFANYWEGEKAATWLMFIWPDNTYTFRAVKKVVDSTHIMLHRSIGKEVIIADLPGVMISFLSFCQFNQDEIEAKYITDSKVDISLNFRNLSFDQPGFTTTTTTTTSTSSSTTSTSSSTTTSNTQSTTSSTTSTTSSTATISGTVTTTTVWIGTWAKRKKITVDNTNIDSALTHFAVPIVLGTSVGQSNQDVSEIFDALVYDNVDDDFTGDDDDLPNSDLWDVVNPITIQNNKLSMNIASGSGAIAPTMDSIFRVSGDFDIQIDWEVPELTHVWGAFIHFRIYGDGWNVRWDRGTNFTNEHISAQYNGSDIWSTGTTIESGKFRIVRSASTITFYYDTAGTGWVQATTQSVDTSDVYLNLLSSHYHDFPGITGSFDNFIVNSGTIVWPENTNPNRKKIAITKNDGLTQLYGEIEHWDSENEKAVIWVSKHDLELDNAATTDLYLYFDSAQDDNDNYIGDTAKENIVTNITGDDFTGTNGDAPDKDLWNNYYDSQDSGDSSGVISIQDNKLDFVTATKTCPVVQSNYTLTGDFSISIDWWFDSTPPGTVNGILGLSIGESNAAIYGDLKYAYVGKYHLTNSDYRAMTYNTVASRTVSSNNSGKFRLVRSGNSLNMDYWNGSSWVTLQTDSSYGNHTVFVKIFTRNFIFTTALDSSFDNFLINSGTVKYTPAQRVWNDDFKAVYHMAQDPNGDVVDSILDSTSNTNHGTPSGTMTSADLVDGFIGKAIETDGVNDLIDIGDTESMDGALTATFEFAGKINALVADGAIMRKWMAGSQAFNFGLSDANSDELAILINDVTGSNALRVDTVAANIAIDTDYILSATWNATNSVIFYKDGVVEAGTIIDDASPASIANVTEHLSISARYNGGSTDKFLSMMARELRLSNINRSAFWLKATNYALKDNLLTFGSTETK